MKTTPALPILLIGTTMIVAMNLWAIERDNNAFQVVCEERGLYCK